MTKNILNLMKTVTAHSESSTLSMKTLKKTKHIRHKLFNTRDRGDILMYKKTPGIMYK